VKFARIFSVLWLAPVLLLTACAPKVKGSYQGVVRNQSYGIDADVFLTLHEGAGFVSGTMTIGAPLSGGGTVSGTLQGKRIQFTTSDGAGGRIIWIGEVSGRTMKGSYIVEPGAMSTLFAGAQKEQGLWVVRR
jgi:hypothetical protein